MGIESELTLHGVSAQEILLSKICPCSDHEANHSLASGSSSYFCPSNCVCACACACVCVCVCMCVCVCVYSLKSKRCKLNYMYMIYV